MKFKLITNLFLCLTLSSSFSYAQESTDVLYEKASVAYKANHYSEALIHLKNLTLKQPNNLTARILMAEVLLASNMGSAAEDELKKASRLGADRSRLLLLLAESYLLQHKYNKVLTYLNKPVQDEILASKIFVLKGHAFLGLRQLKLSEENYILALTLNEGSQNAKLGLVQININYFKYQKALEVVDDVLAGYFPPLKAWIFKASIHQNLAQQQAALKAINTALLENNKHIQALIIRASLYIELASYQNAEQDISTILEQVPYEPKAKFLQAMVDINKAKGQGSAEDTSKIQLKKISETLSRLDADTLKNNPSYYYLASVVAFHQQDYLNAAIYIKSYMAIDSLNTKAMSFAATIDIAQEKYTSAQSMLNKAYFIEEKNPRVLSLLGLVSLRLKQFEKANFYFEQVKIIVPDSANAKSQLAKSYIGLGEYNKAVTSLLSVNSASVNQETISFLLVEAYVKSGKVAKARQLAKKLAQSDPNNKEYIHHLGFVYQVTGDKASAEKSFKKVLASTPLHEKSIISLSEIMFLNKQNEQAISLLNNALEVQPNNIKFIKALGKIYARNKQFDQSVLWLEKAYKKSPNNAELLKQLSYAYLNVGNMTEAVEILESYLINHQKTADIYILLGQHFQRLSNTDKAIQSFTAALKYKANKAEVYFYIANAYKADKQIEEAVATYKKSIAWASNKQPPLLAVTRLLNQEGRSKEAIAIIETFLGSEKLPDRLMLVIAHSYYLAKQLSESAQRYKALLSNHEEKATAGLALVYLAQNRVNKAIKLLTKALKKQPKSFLLNTSLAEGYMMKKDWQFAYNIYLVLIKTYEKQPILLNNIAFVALKLEDYKKAKEYALASLSIAKSYPDALDTLGWVYYLTNEFDKALPLFRQALAINYSKLEIKFHLALTLKALKQDKEAFNTLLEVVNSKRDFSEKKSAQQLLNQWAESFS
ncbi:MAG: PEP-CTERM system TPR-repeat protein PrsT [Colwellia sp.]|nr:PEP-CTERM system TPR-repeat protein PrsT [Colwellia sp.]